MSIDIQEDFEQADGGYAILTLPTSIGDNDGSIRIRRFAGEPDKLGPNGWQPHDAVLKPLAVRDEAGRSALYFGPELTQHLMEQTELEISVLALRSTERVVWPYITPSVNADGGRGAVVTAAIPEVVSQEIKPDPTQGVDKGDDPKEGESDEVIIDPPGPGIAEDDETAGGFNLLWLIPIVLIAVALTYYLLPFESEPDPVADEIAEITEDESNAGDEEDTPLGAPLDTRESLMAEAVACQNDGCDGDAYHDIASRLIDIGVPDVFAIMSLAADNGSVSAMEWLARSYDPLHFEPTEGLTAPDLESAFLYYAQATDAGSEAAAQDKAALCDTLESPEAAEWDVPPDSETLRPAYERNCR